MSNLEKKLCLASLPRTERGTAIVTDVSPDGKTLLYQNGNTVFIRNVENPSICDNYTQHSVQVSVAKYAPSGFYIASGDASGKVRIWDTTNEEHLLKYEYSVLGGKVKDIGWTEDSKRLVVVGEGNEKFGAAIMWDTGTSVGEIRGHNKPINSVAVRQCRPYRVVTAGEDFKLSFFEGPPFKFVKNMGEHTRFVNAVRYSPNGDVFVSGGADGKAFVYEGKTGDLLCELGEPAHQGGIYAIAFSSDSKHLLTASGDKSCKLWDAASRTLISEFPLGGDVSDMQVGCAFAGSQPISVSLSGYINYLNKDEPSQPLRVIKGHNKNITALAVRAEDGLVITGAMDGQICAWDTATGQARVFQGNGHSNMIQYMCANDDELVTISLDDTIMITSLSTMTYSSDRVKLESQPRGLALGANGLQVVACLNEVVVLRHLKTMFTLKIMYEAECVHVHPNQTTVAVGGKDDCSVHIYDLQGDTLVKKQELKRGGAITSVRYSPDGGHIVVTDSVRRLTVYSYPDYQEIVSDMWVRHSAKITCADWTPDSQRIVSGGLDTNLVVYTMGTTKFMDAKAAHPMSSITQVAWLDANTVVSVGHDCCVRIWLAKSK